MKKKETAHTPCAVLPVLNPRRRAEARLALLRQQIAHHTADPPRGAEHQEHVARLSGGTGSGERSERRSTSSRVRARQRGQAPAPIHQHEWQKKKEIHATAGRNEARRRQTRERQKAGTVLPRSWERWGKWNVLERTHGTGKSGPATPNPRRINGVPPYALQ